MTTSLSVLKESSLSSCIWRAFYCNLRILLILLTWMLMWLHERHYCRLSEFFLQQSRGHSWHSGLVFRSFFSFPSDLLLFFSVSVVSFGVWLLCLCNSLFNVFFTRDNSRKKIHEFRICSCLGQSIWFMAVSFFSLISDVLPKSLSIDCQHNTSNPCYLFCCQNNRTSLSSQSYIRLTWKATMFLLPFLTK